MELEGGPCCVAAECLVNVLARKTPTWQLALASSHVSYFGLFGLVQTAIVIFRVRRTGRFLSNTGAHEFTVKQWQIREFSFDV